MFRVMRTAYKALQVRRVRVEQMEPTARTELMGLLELMDSPVRQVVLMALGARPYLALFDPVAADGNDNDTWINTADGTIWKKASGAWTKEYTFPSGTVDPGDHTRRAAISEDDTLVQAEYDAGTTSMDQNITIPTWAGVNRYVFLGIPEAEDDITDIQQAGFSVFGNWERVTGVSFAHKWWRTSDAQSVLSSGLTYTIVQ